MTATDQTTSLRLQVDVDVPQEHAFAVFTEQFDRIKPREYNLLEVDIEQTVFETHVGGHVYDRGVDGSVCRWARVLAFEPPERFVISWDIDARWQLEDDPDRASEVEVRFVPVGASQTRVELHHRHLERHGADWQGYRRGPEGEGGWPVFLNRFRALATPVKGGDNGTKPDLMGLATEERRDLADFLGTLAPEQWQAPSLCQGWSVRDVVAHVVSYEELGPTGLLIRRLKGLGRGGSNEVGRAQYAGRSPADLVAFLRAHLTPRGLTAWFGGAIGLTDGLIHHQDIRRALGAPRTVPTERLVAALNFALHSPKLPSRKDTRGLRLVATDLDWSQGSGPEATGPAEALLMVIAGRPAALADLDGPGASLLAQRLRARQHHKTSSR